MSGSRSEMLVLKNVKPPGQARPFIQPNGHSRQCNHEPTQILPMGGDGNDEILNKSGRRRGICPVLAGWYFRLCANGRCGCDSGIPHARRGSTRYEEHDHPGFVAEMKKLCASCKVLYQNADADIAKQQQQFNSAITQGAKVIVLDPVDSAAAASLVQLAQSRESRSLPMTVLSRRARPISTSPSITRRSARQLRNRSSSI